MSVTVVLNGYKRGAHLKTQLDAIKRQTVQPDEILLWQNFGEDFKSELTSQTTHASCNKNLGVWARFAFALNAKTEYICVFDDDTIPGPKWLENCLETIKVGGLDIMVLPWICSENYDETLKEIKKSKAKIVMGHLELQGFRVNRNLIMEDHGLKPDIFDKFSKVFSGHYHTRSDNGKVFYLGNPYEMFWTDVNDNRGFHIFDTETLTHTPINNPYKLFYNIYYEDTPYQLFDATEYTNKVVKVIVRKKTKPKDFEKFIDKLYTAGIQDLKIIENFEIQESEDFEISEDENTLTILNRYIEESEISIDKNIVKGIFQDIYREACEVE